MNNNYYVICEHISFKYVTQALGFQIENRKILARQLIEILILDSFYYDCCINVMRSNDLLPGVFLPLQSLLSRMGFISGITAMHYHEITKQEPCTLLA